MCFISLHCFHHVLLLSVHFISRGDVMFKNCKYSRYNIRLAAVAATVNIRCEVNEHF